MTTPIAADTHLHTSFSSDSDTPMEQMVLRGIHLGLKTLCFTEHYDFDFPANLEQLDFSLDFDAYYQTWLSLREKYQHNIELLHGIELGVQPHIGPDLDQFYGTYGDRYDFIIHSCHLVDSMDPYEKDYFEKFTPQEGVAKYFETTLLNLKCYTHFQSAGHLDYIYRYLKSPRPDFHYSDYQDLLDEILKTILAQGHGIEVNTAGLKAGLVWPNPHMEILKRYRELGGEIITVGSDGHRPEHMAYAYDRLPDILTEAGFRYYTVFRKQQPYFYPID